MDEVLSDQKKYYQVRAKEYDEWFLRLNRYDRGEANNADWFRDIDLLKSEIKNYAPLGKTLELAAGTGLWTICLKDYSTSIKAIDSSPETLAINKEKVNSTIVSYETADLFNWKPTEKYDFVFFSFWLSHVPEEKFEDFWKLVRVALKPGGRWFFIDSTPDEFSRAVDHSVDPEKDIVTRKLNDGTEYNIIKRFYEVSTLQKRMNDLGWDCQISKTPRFFVYGTGTQTSKET